MKTLFQKFLCVVMLATATFFVACTPEMLQKDEMVDPSGLEFYSPEFKIILSSHHCSEIVLSTGSDGSITKLEGSKIMELGHWLMFDNPDFVGDEGVDTDTIFASFNPNVSLKVVWEVEDPSVLEIQETSVEGGYIVVKAKKEGSTKITAFCEDDRERKTTIKSTVTNFYVTKMEGSDLRADSTNTPYLTENYTIFLDSEDPNSDRLSQKIWMKMDKKPAEAKSPITWTVSEEGIVNLDIREGIQHEDKSWDGDSCLITPIKEGRVSITAQCQYRTVNVVVTVMGLQTFTEIDSLQIVNTTDKSDLKTLWLCRGNQQLVEVLCHPYNALIDYGNYTWRSNNPTAVGVAQSTETETNIGLITTSEVDTCFVYTSLGDSVLAASLDKPYFAKDTLEVFVAPAILDKEFTISAPSGVDLTSMDINSDVQLSSSILVPRADSVLINGGHIDVRWYCDAPKDSLFIEIDSITGKITAHKDMGSDNCKVWAEVTYPKYLDRAGYENEKVKTKSNELNCKVVKKTRREEIFVPVSVSYRTSEDSVYGTIYYPTFKNAEGEEMTLFTVFGIAKAEFNTNLKFNTTDNKVNYPGGNISFTEGDFKFSISEDGNSATYEFIGDIKGSEGSGAEVYLVVTPPSGTLPATKE